MSCNEIVGCVLEDSTFAVMARLQVDGANATQAVVSAITYKAVSYTHLTLPTKA